jgi:hypothetical protein
MHTMLRPDASLSRSGLLLAGPTRPLRNACAVLLAYPLGPTDSSIVTLVFHMNVPYIPQPAGLFMLPHFSTYHVCVSACLASPICSPCFPTGGPPRKAMSNQPSAWNTSLFFVVFLSHLPDLYSLPSRLFISSPPAIRNTLMRMSHNDSKAKNDLFLENFATEYINFAKCEMVPLI